MLNDRPKWVIHGLVMDYIEELDLPGNKVEHYRAFLIRHFGRPMERALIKAEHRYDKLRPSHIRATALHRAYRARQGGRRA